MSCSREEITSRLLDSYQRYYNITIYDDAKLPLRALCEYYEAAEKYVVSRKVNLWTAKGEEFIFLYEMPVLTRELFEKHLAEAREAGMKLAHIGSGHMYTYITPVFVCDSCEPDALTRPFFFPFMAGWMYGWLSARQLNRPLPPTRPADVWRKI